ncbi:MAG TPA: glycosyltransferase family 4 protein, partial [Spirochaetota bacterium]|nr:glycosyltransferase family 4 protein [Spirochaetota bacterium]
MRKILILFPKDSESLFDPESSRTFGGASVQLYNIAHALCRFGDVSVTQGLYEYSNVSPVNTAGAPSIDFVCAENDSVFVKFLKTLRFFYRNNPDYVIQRGLTLFSCMLAFFCLIIRVRFIFMFAHDLEVQGRYQKNGKICPLFFLLKWSSWRLIAQHKWQYAYLPEKKRELVYSGYTIPERKKPSMTAPVLWVGRLEPWKSPELFLELAKRYPSRRFVMVAPSFHRHEDYGKRLHEAAKMIPNLTLYDFVPYREIDSYFMNASYYISTSEKEGFPNTFIQAAMFGVP